jgi:hypothetical protein
MSAFNANDIFFLDHGVSVIKGFRIIHVTEKQAYRSFTGLLISSLH